MEYSEIAGNIMVHLSAITGSMDIRNDKDIPVIFKYVGRLSRVNKALYEATNSMSAAALFLQALSDRFTMAKEDLAVDWNTRGARVWLWDYVKNSQYYEVYKKIQQIGGLINKADKEAPLAIKLAHLTPASSPFLLHQDMSGLTKRGLFLCIDKQGSYLATPFGKKPIYQCQNSKSQSHSELCQHIIGHLADILDTPPPMAENREDYTCYKIGRLPEEPLEEAAWYSIGETAPRLRLINRMLDMCIKKRNGEDPVEKKPRDLSLQKTATSSRIFGTIREVLPWWIEHTKKESRRSFSKEENNLWKPMATSIREVLTPTHYSKGPYWHSKTLEFHSYLRIKIALLLTLEDIITSFKLWEPISLSQYPHISSRESEEEWHLYISRGRLVHSPSDIINGLLPLLGIQNFVRCGHTDIQPTYLWIRKDAFEHVRTKLDLTIRG